jgi:hypothetical protein
MSYACEICERTYHEKFNLDRHVSYCRFLHQSKRERNNQAEIESEPVPELRMLYQWMQDMALKIEKLEKENQQLRGVERKQQKEDVWSYLGKSTPAQSFASWISSCVLPAIPSCLETVYQKDLLSGMAELISKVCGGEGNAEVLPIRAFVHKPTEFYLYENITEENGNRRLAWRKIHANDLNQWFALMESHFQTGFRDHWVVPNMEKINGNDEVYTQRYVSYYQKILGNGRMTTDTRYQRLRTHWFGLIKQKAGNQGAHASPPL